MITKKLRDIISEAIEICIAEENWNIDSPSDIIIERPKEQVNGDFSTPIAMNLASRVRKNPRQISELIISKLNKDNSVIEKVEQAGPGFINFFISQETWLDEIKEIYSTESNFGNSDYGNGKNVQVEFVSANPTGPLHVGHGRGAVIGDTIARILKSAGYKVEREYYINNVGSQIRTLGKASFIRYLQLQGKEIELPDDVYQGDYIKDIAAEIIKEKGDAFVENKESDIPQFCVDYSVNKILDGIKADLIHFNIEFDNWFSEKELYEKNEVQETLEMLRREGHIYDKDGATWLKSSLLGDEKDRVLIKENGDYTYFASDIAYHRNKFSRKYDVAVGIWGADHHGYVPRMKAMIKALGYEKEFFKVILVQLVSLRRGSSKISMSTRAGQFISLRDVMDEVGVDAARYFFLMRNSNSHLEFDLELAKKHSPENPVYYIQYAHARICSVFSQAKEKGVKELDIDNANLKLLDAPEELAIIRALSQYPEIVLKSAISLETHLIPFYLQELASLFHSYYNKYRVISDDAKLTEARLSLAFTARIVLRNALKLLGINAPEKM